MRKLTVGRRNSYLGFAGKVKLYIEDTEGDTVICGVKCRLLGKLKNGEAATFEIDNESRKLFAIFYKWAKNLWNDMYKIPVGEDDIEVSGIVVNNGFAGAPFYFDQTPDDEVYAFRRQNAKRSIAKLLPIFLTFGIAIIVVGVIFIN